MLIGPDDSVTLVLGQAPRYSGGMSECFNPSVKTSEHLIDALRLLCDREGGHGPVAVASGVHPQTLYQIVAGVRLPSGKPRGVGRELQGKLDRVYPGWADAPPSDGRHRPRGLAVQGHSVSQEMRSDVPHVIWEQIKMGALPARFTVNMPDDSMHPFLRPGHTLRFARDEAPRAGDWVLVSDSTGAAYVRVYRQRRPGYWQAAPLNEAYDALDSERDGLVVLAVFMGMEGRQG
jgi:hypothetical protein